MTRRSRTVWGSQKSTGEEPNPQGSPGNTLGQEVPTWEEFSPHHSPGELGEDRRGLGREGGGPSISRQDPGSLLPRASSPPHSPSGPVLLYPTSGEWTLGAIRQGPLMWIVSQENYMIRVG